MLVLCALGVERLAGGARGGGGEAERVRAREPVARVSEARLAAVLPEAERGGEVTLVRAVAREAHEAGAEAGTRVLPLFAAAREEPVRLHVVLAVGRVLCAHEDCGSVERV